MIRRIILENFMAHRHTVIEPADGLTLLTGPNNCGKSAVVVALQTLCENDSRAKLYIRHGAREARVYVETGEGHKLEWRRPRNGSAYYILDGRRVDRVGQGVPEDLHEMLRLPQVRDDRGEEFDVHFSEQKSPIFLLNAPGGRAATFFASSSDAGLLIRMQAKHKENTADARKEQRRLEEEIERDRRALAAFESLAGLETKLDKAQDLHASLRQAIERAAALGERLRRCDDQAHRIEAEQASAIALRPLEEPPPVTDTQPLASLIADIEHQQAEVRREDAVLRAAAGLEPTPSIQQEGPLRETLDRLESTLRTASQAELVCDVLRPAHAPPDTTDTAQLRDLVLQIQTQQQAFAAGHTALEATPAIDTPPDAADPEPLAAIIRRLSLAKEQEKHAAADLHLVEDEFVRLKETIRLYVERHPHCPTCGGQLNATSLTTVLEGSRG